IPEPFAPIQIVSLARNRYGSQQLSFVAEYGNARSACRNPDTTRLVGFQTAGFTRRRGSEYTSLAERTIWIDIERSYVARTCIGNVQHLLLWRERNSNRSPTFFR